MNYSPISTPLTFIVIILIALAANIGASEFENDSLLNPPSRLSHKMTLGGGSIGEFEYLQFDGQMLLSPNVGIEGEFYLGAGIGGGSLTLDSRDLFDVSGLDLTLTSGIGVSDQDVDFGAYGKHKISLTQYSGGGLLSYLSGSAKADNFSFKGLGLRYTADGSLTEEERLQIGVEGANGHEIHTANFKLGSGKQRKSEFSALLHNGVAATLKREQFDDQLDGSQNLDSGWMGKLGLHNTLTGTSINYDLDAGYAFDVSEFVYDAAVSADLMGGSLGGRLADSPLGQKKEIFFTHSCVSLELFDIDQRDGEDNIGAMLSYSFQCSSRPKGLDRSLATELSERWKNRDIRISQPVYGSGMRGLIAATTRPVRADLTNETIQVTEDLPPQAVINGFPAQLSAGLTLTLDGSASIDTEGAIAAYNWQSSGDCVIRGAANEVTVTFLVATQAVLCGARLTVTDSVGQTNSVLIQGTVTPQQNTPPIAIISGMPATALASESFVVSGTSSNDAEGPISSYLWTASGSCSISGSNSGATTTLQIAASALLGNTCTLGLTVADSEGLTDTTQAQTTITALTNTSPTAIITGLPATALASESFVVSGTSSNDAEGPIASYLWTASGPCSIAGSNSGATTTLQISASALPGDTCTVGLTVADSEGLTDTTQAQTTITALTNTSPTAIITGLPATALALESFSISGTSSNDAEGPIASYLWTASGSCSISGSNSGATTTLQISASALPGDTCTVRLTVADSEGLTDTTQAQTTISAPTNTSPTAIITGLPATALASESFVVSGTSSNDAEGPIASYLWTASGPCSISGSNSGATTTLQISASALPGNTCTVGLTVADSEGLTDTTQAQTVVTASPNTAPIAVINNINTIPFGSGQQHTLDGSGSSDAEGPIVSYSWSSSSVNCPLSTTSGSTVTVFVPSSISCNVSLTVTDQGGLSNTAQLTF